MKIESQEKLDRFAKWEEIDFANWKSWDEDRWLDYERKLSLHDPVINDIFKDQWFEFLSGEGEGSDDRYDFLVRACERSPNWALLVTWEWATIVCCKPELANDPVLRRMIIAYCDACDVVDGYYAEDDGCNEEFGGVLNRWACVLTVCPQLMSDCTTYHMFNGYCQCVLLTHQPQFAEKFALDELGDPDGKCWAACWDEDYQNGWEVLLNAHPEFAKYRKG